jgi:hypothetical protein
MKRVIFDSFVERQLFFDEIFHFLNAKTWSEVYSYFNVPKSVFEKYRFGHLTIPEELFTRFLLCLSHARVSHFSAKLTYLDDNWGKAKGGKVTYSKYREIFDKGRLIGISKFKRKVSSKYKINQDLLLNKDLAYFMGLFIAEGFTNIYGRHYQTQLIGHWSEESEFYKELVSDIVLKLFGITPYIRKEKFSDTIRFNLISKDLFFLITNRFKISAGKKSYSVLIPEEIVNSTKDNLICCISGIFDGEACFFVDRRDLYKNPYPRIDLHMNNPGIIKQISEIFNKCGIEHNFTKDYSRIQIYGDKKVRAFLNNVGFSNPKHLKKVERHFGKIYVKKLI